MNCEICGRSAPIPSEHTCPKKTLDRIDREHRRASLDAEIQDEPEPPEAPRITSHRHCVYCGRFLSRDGRCPKVFYDDYAGAWEHG